ncbi:unnamed protein product [Rangifer tarandus platyrhynchus]|uniref:Uncharacterized protein n=1 Tax=Rangifer tarandus platyrhynchus TaxID=3082113 RepID=A0ABN8Y2C0_RANTA|nr:unnamed protein product [Rangifer tarandus platyrhynchus]
MFVQGQAPQQSIPGPRSQPVRLPVSQTVTVYTRTAPRAFPRRAVHSALQSWPSLLLGFDDLCGEEARGAERGRSVRAESCRENRSPAAPPTAGGAPSPRERFRRCSP